MHTANQSSFFFSWWFRSFDTEAPQLKRHLSALCRISEAENLVSPSASGDEVATAKVVAPLHVHTHDLLRQFQDVYGTGGSGSDNLDDNEPHALPPDSDSEDDDLDDADDTDWLGITPSQSASQSAAGGAPSQSFSDGAQALSTAGLPG